MADKRNWYYRQLVTEANLDEAFDLMELADQNYAIDNGLIGVYRGLDVAEAGVPNLTVQITAGAAYDQTGQRIVVPSTQILNVAVDSLAVTTTVAGGGNSKIISIFAKFKRALSNVKVDGNGVNVQYNMDESFEFIVRQSAEAVGPTAPALDSDEILLCDITRVFGDTAVVDSMISTTRREWAISATAGSYTVRTGQTEAAIQAVLTHVNTLDTATGVAIAAAVSAHTGDATDAHAATAITNTPAGTIAATTVQAAIDELDSEKGSKAVANSWTAKQTFTDTIAVTSASGAKTVTYKLLSSTAVDENSRHFEVYATGTPATIVLETPPDEHVTSYEVSAVICRQGSITNTQCAFITGGVYRTGGVLTLIGSDEVSSVGAEGGGLALALSGGNITISLVAPVNPMNIRLIVHAHSVKAAA